MYIITTTANDAIKVLSKLEANESRQRQSKKSMPIVARKKKAKTTRKQRRTSRSRDRWTMSEVNNLKEMATERKTVKHIARKLGRTTGSIKSQSCILRKRGIDIPFLRKK